MHTRASKWGERLQRLFVLADVKTQTVMKRRRSGGVLKAEPEEVKVSSAHPHMLRHTLVRDLLEHGTSMEEIAELLGNTVEATTQNGTGAGRPASTVGCRDSGRAMR